MYRSILLFVAFAAACGGSPLSADVGVPVDLKTLNANRDAYVNKTISVRGRMHVEPYRSAEPCGPATPDCDRPFATSVHVVATGEARSDQNSVDLYRESSSGNLEPVSCRIDSATTFDCGTFAPNATATISGTYVKSRVPYQSIGTSGAGSVVVLQYRDAFVLVVKN